MKLGRNTVVIKLLIYFSISLVVLSVEAQEASPSCSKEQLRFEQALRDRASFELSSTNQDIGPSCVLHSMKMFDSWLSSMGKSSGRAARVFAVCPSEVAQMERTTKGPCRTREYLKRLVEDYNVVTDCLEISAKQFYPFVSVESGFIQNAMAVGNDVGLGQLTPPAVADVNAAWPALVARVQFSSRPSCRALQPHLSSLKVEMSGGEFPFCAFVASPANPLRNLFYSAAFFQLNQDYFRKAFVAEDIGGRIEFLVKRRFDQIQIERLARSLSMLSYNLGFPSIMSHLKAYLEKHEMKSQQLRQRLLEQRDELIAMDLALEQRGLSLSAQREMKAQRAILRDQVRKAESTLREPVLFETDFDLMSSSTSAFAPFLRSRGASGYLDLLTENLKRAEKVFGPHVCTDRGMFEALFDEERWQSEPIMSRSGLD